MVVRIAVIGTGRVGQARVRELARRDDTRLVAVASRRLDRARELAAPHGAEAVDDWHACLDRSDIDAVMVCTHNQMHAEIAEAGLRAGKHVSVDYPLALSLADADRLMAAANRSGRVLHVEHIELLSPWFRVLEEHLSSIGPPLFLRWTDVSNRPAGPGDWTFERASGFSFFSGAAMPSRLVKLAGPAVWVDAVERLHPSGDRFERRVTAAQIGFAGGAVGQVWDAVGMPVAGESSKLVVVGERGTLTAENRATVTLATPDSVMALPVPASTGLFARDIAEFVGRVVGNEPAYVTLDHVGDVMRLADAAERSCRSGERVFLEVTGGR